MMYRNRCITTVNIALDMDFNVLWRIWHVCIINEAGLSNNDGWVLMPHENTASYLEEEPITSLQMYHPCTILPIQHSILPGILLPGPERAQFSSEHGRSANIRECYRSG